MSNQKATPNNPSLLHASNNSNKPVSTIVAEAEARLNHLESMNKDMFPHEGVENFAEPERTRLKALHAKINEHVAESRKVYADLAKDPSSQSVARRRMALEHDLKGPGGILSELQEITAISAYYVV
ncbi:hypothetical protein MMC10_004060 [Thelotrema lepadinum]|nr:hypothetical protein [Thelotrema lepadinum]